MVSKQSVDAFRVQRRTNLGLPQDCSWIVVNAVERIESYLKNFNRVIRYQPLEELFKTPEEPEFLWLGMNDQIAGSHSMTGPF